MPTGPAARIGDMTAHGSPLAPGPPSPNVLIGGMPAWLAAPPGFAAMLAAAVAAAAAEIGKAQAAATAAQGTPGAAAAQANVARTAADQVGKLAAMMTGSGASIHACPIIKLIIPDGPGVDVTGSTTVMISKFPASRMGDTIQECTSVNVIAAGCMNVIIGG
jgi:uncharacterized Zn-binding protein involved in type VI secretion